MNSRHLHFILPTLFTILIVAVMTAAAELIPEREVIFPEIGAIAVGALISPRFTWQTDKKHILFYIMLCAVLGMGIVYLVPLPLVLQLILAYAVSQFVFTLSKTTFAPMVSAIVLPVMLGTKTPLYLVSAFLFTSIILAVRSLFEHLQIRPEEKYIPADTGNLSFTVKKIVIASVVITAAIMSGHPFISAPPVLVAFTEFASPTAKARKHPVKAILLISLCGTAGALLRLLLTSNMGLPLTLSAVLTILAAILFIRIFHMYLPPAGAIALLAMLVPETALPAYPLSVLIGISAYMCLAKVFFRD